MSLSKEKSQKLEAYYAKEDQFKAGISLLREIALKTELQETLKWGAPIYTIDNKNVIGILRFKKHFGLWFYNGVFLSDPKKVLGNAQEGKTKAMRHWKFYDINDVDTTLVTSYIKEAIENQKKGIALVPERKKEMEMPVILADALDRDEKLKVNFNAFSPYKQQEFIEYITEAKREKTKCSRLEKCLPLIRNGIGLMDKYRK